MDNDPPLPYEGHEYGRLNIPLPATQERSSSYPTKRLGSSQGKSGQVAEEHDQEPLIDLDSPGKKQFHGRSSVIANATQGMLDYRDRKYRKQFERAKEAYLDTDLNLATWRCIQILQETNCPYSIRVETMQVFAITVPLPAAYECLMEALQIMNNQLQKKKLANDTVADVGLTATTLLMLAEVKQNLSKKSDGKHAIAKNSGEDIQTGPKTGVNKELPQPPSASSKTLYRRLGFFSFGGRAIRGAIDGDTTEPKYELSGFSESEKLPSEEEETYEDETDEDYLGDEVRIPYMFEDHN